MIELNEITYMYTLYEQMGLTIFFCLIWEYSCTLYT